MSNDNPWCDVLENCTGLRCDQRDGVLNGSSATFVVTKCVDPVAVDLSIESRGGDVGQFTFTENGTALLAAASIAVGMRRNASHLFFQVSLLNYDNIDEVGVMFKMQKCITVVGDSVNILSIPMNSILTKYSH